MFQNDKRLYKNRQILHTVIFASNYFTYERDHKALLFPLNEEEINWWVTGHR